MSEYFHVLIPKDYYALHPNNIKFKTNMNNSLNEACVNRGWKEIET